jgi:hypothetical protein
VFVGSVAQAPFWTVWPAGQHQFIDPFLTHDVAPEIAEPEQLALESQDGGVLHCPLVQPKEQV